MSINNCGRISENVSLTLVCSRSFSCLAASCGETFNEAARMAEKQLAWQNCRIARLYAIMKRMPRIRKCFKGPLDIGRVCRAESCNV